MEDLKNILVTGGGAPGAPGIIRALQISGNLRLISCDIKERTIGSLLADEYFTVPSGKNTDYASALLNKCIEHSIDLILPITTKEIITLSQRKHLFENEGIEVVVSNYESLRIANNKGLLLKHLSENGVETPAFKICNSTTEFKHAAKDLGYPENQFVFKPTIANGSRGFRIVSNSINRSDLLFNYKPNNLHISYSEILEILEAKENPELVLMEYIPGTEYSIDCLISKGSTNYIIPRKRSQIRAGVSIAGEIEHNQAIIDYCKDILNTLDLEGPIGIQVKLDSKGIPKILEINPRLQGTSVACLGAGINLPLLSVEKSLKNTFNEGVKWGTKFIRYYAEEYYN